LLFNKVESENTYIENVLLFAYGDMMYNMAAV